MVQPVIVIKLSSKESRAIAIFCALTAVENEEDALRNFESYFRGLTTVGFSKLVAPTGTISRAENDSSFGF